MREKKYLIYNKMTVAKLGKGRKRREICEMTFHCYSYNVRRRHKDGPKKEICTSECTNKNPN